MFVLFIIYAWYQRILNTYGYNIKLDTRRFSGKSQGHRKDIRLRKMVRQYQIHVTDGSEVYLFAYMPGFVCVAPPDKKKNDRDLKFRTHTSLGNI